MSGTAPTTPGWDPDPIESLVMAMARSVRTGDIWGVGMGTTVPLVALALARAATDEDFKVFVPELGAYAVHLTGSSGAPGAALTAGAELIQVPVTQVLDEDLGLQYREFFRPAQIDAYGSVNTARVGGHVLVGYAGLADAMARYDDIFCYTPRHDARTFVAEVECVTARATTAESGRRCTVLTDLGAFELDAAVRALRVRHLAPTTDLNTVRARTGIEVIADDPVPYQAPDPDLLAMLRNIVDPTRRRDAENVSRTRPAHPPR